MEKQRARNEDIASEVKQMMGTMMCVLPQDLKQGELLTNCVQKCSGILIGLVKIVRAYLALEVADSMAVTVNSNTKPRMGR